MKSVGRRRGGGVGGGASGGGGGVDGSATTAVEGEGVRDRGVRGADPGREEGRNHGRGGDNRRRR